MAAGSLLALLDDIASILDDVAVLTKVAAKKTAGVLGDDLALNAQQVAGVRADRELPVVWAVARGSMWNKAILVPAALAISAFAPWAITPLLMLGGAFLCFEGCEKLAHRWLHSGAQDQAAHARLVEALADPAVDPVALERDKIKGAIRTDFILSGEIIVIALGTVAAQPFATRATVLASVAVGMTIGVYGLVAAIVKLDDLGLHWARPSGAGAPAEMRRAIGRAILRSAPWLMKGLSVAGTAAMFLVGGSILMHGLAPVHHAIEPVLTATGERVGPLAQALAGMLADALVGVVAGAIVLAGVSLGKRWFGRGSTASDGSH